MTIIAYMDDIKVHTGNQKAASAITEMLRTAAQELGLSLNVAKCAVYGRNLKPEEVDDMDLPYVDTNYKHLGLFQIERDQNVNIEVLEEKILRQAKTIMESRLSSFQKRAIFNSTTIPAAIYVTGNVLLQESVATTLLTCESLDKEIGKIATQAQIKTRSTSNQRLYMSTSVGGLGYKSIALETAIHYVRRYWYLQNNEELVVTREYYECLNRGKCRTPISDYQHVLEKYKVTNIEATDEADRRKAAQTIIKAIYEQNDRERKETWAKSMFYPKLIVKYYNKISFPAIQCRQLDSSKLSLLNAAAEEQWFAMRGISKQNGGICRRCRSHEETAYHVVTACKHNYAERHDFVAYWLIRTIIEATKAPVVVKNQLKFGRANLNCEYTTEGRRINITCGIPVLTPQRIHHKKPDVLVKVEKEDKTTIYVFEVVIPHLQNYETQEAVKITRYAKNSVTHVDHLNYSTVGRDANLVDELRQMNRCPVKFGVMAIGVFGEVLSTDTQKKLWSLLAEMGVTETQIRSLLEKAAYSALTGTARILMKHVGKQEEEQ
nr:uncharacterized protein LOC111415615 [Onthophagus taurus]